MSKNKLIVNPETVYWINGREYGRIERIKKWLYELSGQGTYVSKNRIPFTTHIPVDDIDSLADEQLKISLRRQLGNLANNDPSITIPVATMDGSAFMNVWHIPRGPILSRQYTSEDNQDL